MGFQREFDSQDKTSDFTVPMYTSDMSNFLQSTKALSFRNRKKFLPNAHDLSFLYVWNIYSFIDH